MGVSIQVPATGVARVVFVVFSCISVYFSLCFHFVGGGWFNHLSFVFVVLLCCACVAWLMLSRCRQRGWPDSHKKLFKEI